MVTSPGLGINSLRLGGFWMLVAVGRISGWSVVASVIILCREVLVSGLREFLAELQVVVHVTKLAKYKTFIQMCALAFLLLGDAAYAWFPAVTIGVSLLWVAALLTVVTGADYLMVGMRHIGAADNVPIPAAATTAKSRTAPRK
jgi:phosphatidylglycerophosphate synthase